jgi:hypothetical protein
MQTPRNPLVEVEALALSGPERPLDCTWWWGRLSGHSSRELVRVGLCCCLVAARCSGSRLLRRRSRSRSSLYIELGPHVAR